MAAGLGVLGENHVREAAGKTRSVAGARWHLVGHLQSNKARDALRLFEAIHSLDSLALARRLDRLAGEASEAGEALPWRGRLPVYLQVNVDADPAKEGFSPEALGDALPELAGLARLELLGLMTVGRLVARPEEARPTFIRLRESSERLRAAGANLGPGLSMGMSDDFEVAVEEGATTVRVGRVVFGERSRA